MKRDLMSFVWGFSLGSAGIFSIMSEAFDAPDRIVYFTAWIGGVMLGLVMSLYVRQYRAMQSLDEGHRHGD